MATWARATLPQLLLRITGDIASRTEGMGFLRRSVEHVFGFVLAGMAHHLYEGLDYTRRQLFPQSADIEGLTEWGDWLDVPRKPGAFATGPAHFPGSAPVPADTLLQDTGGALYRVGSAIDAGARIYQVIALARGAAYNLPVGTKLTLSSSIAGLELEATTAADWSGGDELEEIEAYRPRVIDALRSPVPTGADGDYVRWALSRPGVTRAWEFPRRMGAGTVSLGFVFDGRADIFPTADDVAAMQAYIDSVRPADLREVIVQAPVKNALYISVTARGTLDAYESQEPMENALLAFFTSDAQLEEPIALSQIDEVISQFPGEQSHTITAIALNMGGDGSIFIDPSASEIVPSSWGLLTIAQLTLTILP